MRVRAATIGLWGAIALLGSGLVAPTASAVSITLVPTTPTTVSPGERVEFDIYLSDAPANISAFNVGVWYVPDLLEYVPERSSATSYILYTGGKGAAYLVPFSDPWSAWTGPNPVGLARVDIGYRAVSTGGAVTRAGDGVFLGNLSFDWIGFRGISQVELNFVDLLGTCFIVDGVDIKDSVGVNSIEVAVLPEPTTGLLVGLGLGGLGAVSRRRRALRVRDARSAIARQSTRASFEERLR